MKIIDIDGKELTIRRAVKEDAEPLIDYINKISYESDFLTFGPGEFTVTKKQEEDFIESYKDSTNNLLIVAEINGKIVGNLNFNGNTKLRCRHSGEFGVSVLKEYWGKGIARECILYMLHWAKEVNITKIQLNVREDNLSGVKLYEKLGFIREGLISRFFYMNNKYYSAIIMGLELE